MRKHLPILIIITAVIITAAVYPQIPERMPTHWSIRGEVDGWSRRLWGAWLLPLLMPVLWGIFRGLPHIDPRKANYAKFASTYEWIIASVLAFMLLMQVIILAAATGRDVPMERVTPFGVGVMFLIIGNLLPRARSNWFVGIRTPWTLTSERSWERTHRVGGYVLVLIGLAMIVVSFVSPVRGLIILPFVVFPVVLLLIAYSYFVWKQDKHSGAVDQNELTK
ncbi:MAG TPA: SdpI family protein [Gemmatimonadaceae bacterium]